MFWLRFFLVLVLGFPVLVLLFIAGWLGDLWRFTFGGEEFEEFGELEILEALEVFETLALWFLSFGEE